MKDNSSDNTIILVKIHSCHISMRPANSVRLNDGKTIFTNTIIWSGGVAPNPIIEELACERDNQTNHK